jgi:Zn-dependent oligopeptidase
LPANFEDAARFGSVVSIPDFETTPAQLRKAVDDAIALGNARLDAIGRLAPGAIRFETTVRALDDLIYDVTLVGDRVDLIKETSADAAMRGAAADLVKVIQDWGVALPYREDVYRSVKAYVDSGPQLAGEDARLLEETMRDYRRAGLHLPKAGREEVERLRKEEARLATDFRTAITRARQTLVFTRAELDGTPASFLETQGVQTGPDAFSVQVNVTFQYLAVMENARREETRRRVYTARNNLAREENLPRLQQLVELRDRIARALGYATWADYQIEPRMARDARTATEFLERMKSGLQAKFDAELEQFRRLKAAETGDANARVAVWDLPYCINQFKKQRYDVDDEQLSAFFPYDRVLQGMFDLYQLMFGLRFEEVTPPYRWAEGVRLFAVSDAATGEPMGLFYLDMFPREGKYNHFAQFSLVGGKRLPDGRYRRPVAVLVCNFPPPQPGRPSLLKHDEVETLFHEFGHAMHTLLTRAGHARFSGTNVPRDFVEAPSQMLERWVWEQAVLDRFAADYRDPAKRIPPEVMTKLKESRLAVEGTRYRRQASLALLDLALHTQVRAGEGTDCNRLANRIQGDVYLPVPDDTAFIAYFGHLAGYDAGYYGYAWADAIAADLATVFEQAPNGYFDTAAGMKLRNEIYAPGDSRDANESVRRFLGRERSLAPFFKYIGADVK